MIPSFRQKAIFLSGINRAAYVKHGKDSGFSLVEIMVAMVLGLLLLGTIVQTYTSSRMTYGMTEGISRVQENYRYVMTHLSRNMNSGGYAGCLENVAGEHISTLSNGTGQYNFSMPVSGVEGATATTPDSLTVTRAIGAIRIPFSGKMDDVQTSPEQDFNVDSSAPGYAALERWQVLTVSNCTRAATFMITNDPTASAGLIQHRVGQASPGPLNIGLSNTTADLQIPFLGDGLDTNGAAASLYTTVGVVYSIGTSAAGNAIGIACDPNDATTHRYCALLANGQELIEGVHNMQVTYGVQSGSNIRFDDAGGLTIAEAQNVESVRVTLSMNTVRPTTTSADVIRRDFTRTFRVRNRTP